MRVFKIVAYVVLIGLGIWAGKGFYAAKHEAEARANPTNDVPAAIVKPAPVETSTNSPAATFAVVPTNGMAGGSNVNGAVLERTNATVAVTDRAKGRGTNTLADSTNGTQLPKSAPGPVAAGSNGVAAPQVDHGNSSTAADVPVVGGTAGTVGAGYGKMIRYFGGFVLVAIILGMMLAHEISQFFGHKTMEFLFNDEGVGMRNPEYEEAEQVWVNGDYLGAIQLMREYFKKYPRELYVAMRIAEIYEKDLGNYLAAILEYENILQYKFDRQRWGWAAIHLCNLYSKMGRTDQAIELLYRIHHEFGETPAAAKARKRLAQIDPNFDAVGEAIQEADVAAGEPGEPESIPEAKEPPSNLPPGFRAKKK